MFFIDEMQLDIAFATFVVSRFIKNLIYQYIKAVKTIFRYLKDLQNQNIIYEREKKLHIKVCSDSD